MTSTLKKNPLSFLLGLAVFAGLLYWIRATTVMEHLARVGPWIMVLILAYGLVQLCFTLAWRVLLDSDAGSVGFWELFRVYLAGRCRQLCGHDPLETSTAALKTHIETGALTPRPH